MKNRIRRLSTATLNNHNRRESRTVIIFWLTAILLIVGGAAMGWTVEDCIEVNWDHPDCDQYPTTTTSEVTTTTAEVTTTTAEVTTTTEGNGTTTTTPNSTTTQPQPEETTTTIPVVQCPPGTVHQPPFCVNPTVEIDQPLVVETPTEETLPFTGPGVPTGPLALAASLFLLLGLGCLTLDRREG